MLQREYFKWKKESELAEKDAALDAHFVWEEASVFRRLSLGTKFDTLVTADLFLGERLKKIWSQTVVLAFKSSVSLSSIIQYYSEN